METSCAIVSHLSTSAASAQLASSPLSPEEAVCLAVLSGAATAAAVQIAATSTALDAALS